MTTSRRVEIEERVLRATEELLREGTPYSELGIERIATRAGITRTAFYFYFRDKRELLMRVTAGVADSLFAVADNWWSGEGEGAGELKHALRAVIGLYQEHGGLLRAIVQAAATDREIASFWRHDVVDRFVRATRARIEAEQVAGRVPPELPAAGVAFALTWMTERTVYEHVVQGGPERAEELVQALSAVWLRAVYGG